MESKALWQAYKAACRHLYSELDRDPYSPTKGCFDRRYWGWKLVDFPEATYQRAVQPLAWWLKSDPNLSADEKLILLESIRSGLGFAIEIQHPDGSFDQAFPHEHSFGATAFLLNSLMDAFKVIQGQCSIDFQLRMTRSLQKSAEFLCRNDETHGFISNHLAGAALGLMEAGDYFDNPRYLKRANELLNTVLIHQSAEGWFVEYDGADPGYQTLCMYYLAEIYRRHPEERLRVGLKEAIDFLAWFIHPDGSFGGEYGSRRTAIYYPGGLAYLSKEYPLAHRMTQTMVLSALEGRTISPGDVDIANLAPLLATYALAMECEMPMSNALPALPFEEANWKDFPEAGLHIRGTGRYYAVLGVSNGGVLKVFDRQSSSIMWNDGGYVGGMGRVIITTQKTDRSRKSRVELKEISIESQFYKMPRTLPNPPRFIILRILNLTIMRNVFFGNLMKKVLVKLLIRTGQRVGLSLTRTIRFEPTKILIKDRLTLARSINLRWLEFGRPFISIHMASANYFENSGIAKKALEPVAIDVPALLSRGTIENQVTL